MTRMNKMPASADSESDFESDSESGVRVESSSPTGRRLFCGTRGFQSSSLFFTGAPYFNAVFYGVRTRDRVTASRWDTHVGLITSLPPSFLTPATHSEHTRGHVMCDHWDPPRPNASVIHRYTHTYTHIPPSLPPSSPPSPLVCICVTRSAEQTFQPLTTRPPHSPAPSCLSCMNSSGRRRLHHPLCCCPLRPLEHRPPS